MATDERATAKQWKMLGGLSREFGVASATALAALHLERTEQDIRAHGLSRGDASKVITAFFNRQRK